MHFLFRTSNQHTKGKPDTRLKRYVVIERIDYFPFGIARGCGVVLAFGGYGSVGAGGEPVQRIDHAERFFAATGAEIHHGGNSAYYTVGHDRIQMLPFESFRDAESYYATLAHEVTHWTRHPSRLDREFGRKRWGDEGYAQEELVAELGSAFLAADLGLELEPRKDHSAYIASWLKVLKDDKRAIFRAAAHAQRAADYLHGLQDSGEESAAA